MNKKRPGYGRGPFDAAPVIAVKIGNGKKDSLGRGECLICGATAHVVRDGAGWPSQTCGNCGGYVVARLRAGIIALVSVIKDFPGGDDSALTIANAFEDEPDETPAPDLFAAPNPSAPEKKESGAAASDTDDTALGEDIQVDDVQDDDEESEEEEYG